MFDIANNELKVGDKVRILKCEDYPFLKNRIAIVMAHQDCENKIKVSLDYQWQGYFRFCDIIKINQTTINENKKIQIELTVEEIKQLVSALYVRGKLVRFGSVEGLFELAQKIESYLN
jgi:hypothetical protein